MAPIKIGFILSTLSTSVKISTTNSRLLVPNSSTNKLRPFKIPLQRNRCKFWSESTEAETAIPPSQCLVPTRGPSSQFATQMSSLSRRLPATRMQSSFHVITAFMLRVVIKSQRPRPTNFPLRLAAQSSSSNSMRGQFAKLWLGIY